MKLNAASVGEQPMDWTSIDVVGRRHRVYELTLSTRITRVAATITNLNLFDFVSATDGSIAYESTTIDVPTLASSIGRVDEDRDYRRVGFDRRRRDRDHGHGRSALRRASIVSGHQESWRTIESSLTSGSLNGIDGLTLAVSGIQVKLNARPASASQAVWTGPRSTSCVPTISRLRADAEHADHAGCGDDHESQPVRLRLGDRWLDRLRVDDDRRSDARRRRGALTKIAITVGSASIGAGGIGITVTGGQLYVASIVSGTKSWRTIESSLTSGSLNGIDGLTLAVAGIQVKLNDGRASASSRWTGRRSTSSADDTRLRADAQHADHARRGDDHQPQPVRLRLARPNGSIAYESTTIDVPTLSVVDGALTKIAITVGSASIGAGGIGITVTGGELYVA